MHRHRRLFRHANDILQAQNFTCICTASKPFRTPSAVVVVMVVVEVVVVTAAATPVLVAVVKTSKLSPRLEPGNVVGVL